MYRTARAHALASVILARALWNLETLRPDDALRSAGRAPRWLVGDVSGAERVGALGGVLGGTADADGGLGALRGSGELGLAGVWVRYD